MDNNISTGLALLIGAVGGIGALIGALITSLLNIYVENRRDEREHQRWTREKKWEAYSSLLQKMLILRAFAISATGNQYYDERLTLSQECGEAVERAVLISDKNTRSSIFDIRDTFFRALIADVPDGDASWVAMTNMRDLLTSQMHQQPVTKRSAGFGNTPPNDKEPDATPDNRPTTR